MIKRAQEERVGWVARNFGQAMLGDKRRGKRLEKIALAMATKPGSSIPQLCETSYEVKATYTLFKNKQVSPDNIQIGHRELVKQELERRGVYLLVEDTTEMAWGAKEARKGLGPVGSGQQPLQGFQLHSVLALKWFPAQAGQSKRTNVEVLGLCDQQYHIRKPREEKRGNRTDGAIGELETEIWDKASHRIGKVLNINGARWLRICDRGADIYEFLQGCQELGHEFVVRASHNRVLINASGERIGNLFNSLKEKAVLGEFSLALRGREKKPARSAKLSLSLMSVSLRAPQRPGFPRGKKPPINCLAIRVWEATPPQGEKAIEWVLLCSTEIATFEQALECVLQYSARWIIEEFHKVLKTGLGAQRLQLESAAALFAAIAIMSIVALRLINLREVLRLDAEAPAPDSGLSEIELSVLRLKLNKPLDTVGEVALAIGRLGGHLNRKSDGLPGWQTLWRGMLILNNLVDGFLLANLSQRFG